MERYNKMKEQANKTFASVIKSLKLGDSKISHISELDKIEPVDVGLYDVADEMIALNRQAEAKSKYMETVEQGYNLERSLLGLVR